jgi:hypothetical protein
MSSPTRLLKRLGYSATIFFISFPNGLVDGSFNWACAAKERSRIVVRNTGVFTDFFIGSGFTG